LIPVASYDKYMATIARGSNLNTIIREITVIGVTRLPITGRFSRLLTYDVGAIDQHRANAQGKRAECQTRISSQPVQLNTGLLAE